MVVRDGFGTAVVTRDGFVTLLVTKECLELDGIVIELSLSEKSFPDCMNMLCTILGSVQ